MFKFSRETYRDSDWKDYVPPPVLTDMMLEAIREFAEANGVSEYSPEILSFADVDEKEVVEYFNDHFNSKWDCADYLKHALRVGHVAFCFTGLDMDGVPLIAVHFWSHIYSDPEMQCSEIFIAKGTLVPPDNKKMNVFPTTHQVVWWY